MALGLLLGCRPSRNTHFLSFPLPPASSAPFPWASGPLGRLGSRKNLELKASRMILISLAPESRPQRVGMMVLPPPRLQLLWGLEIISGHRDRMSGVWALLRASAPLPDSRARLGKSLIPGSGPGKLGGVCEVASPLPSPRPISCIDLAAPRPLLLGTWAGWGH
uniref:Uncharacterized protein n=1 Tax=Myotis myotis TaxID=51298 RepID=A0A7J7WHJ0_MYOMY|nr:hypothetical protein mMyoMyo1_012051 [Myotis myotis]